MDIYFIKTMIVLSILLVIVGFILFYIFNYTGNTFDKLFDLKKRVEETNDTTKLVNLYEELKKIERGCWHIRLQNEVNIIAAIIRTKYKILVNEENKKQE